jgi:hypothetical protein
VSRADRPGASNEPFDADADEAADDEGDDDAEPLERTSLPGALGRAAVDFYYESIRLVPANVIWGVLLVALGWAAIGLGIWVAIVGAPLLGPPLAGIYRLAGLVTRGQHVVLSDAFAATRELFVPSLLLAAVVGWGLGLLALNVALGINASSPLGWGFATLAGWGAVALLIYAIVAWPLLADPARAFEPARERARLAGYVVLAAPFRMFGLTVIVVVLAVVSTIAFAALVTISVAFIALVSSRIVLPDADRLVERLGECLGARDRR